MCLKKIRDNLLKRDLCGHCFGRQFALLGHGLENYERGAILQSVERPEVSDLSPARVPDDATRGGDCFICEGLFERIDEFVNRIIQCVKPYEFDTYLVGSRIRETLTRREEKLQEEVGVKDAEPINRELNRLIGKELEAQYPEDVSVHQDEPDLMAIVDTREDKIELQVSSLYVFGRYNKYVRDLPQTVWYCRKCRGSGCDYCDGTGKMYESSVQERIQEPFVQASKAKEAVFHGAGREDIDARCFGKRPFVLELKHPRVRSIDLNDLKNEVNDSGEEVEIFDLQLTRSRTVAHIKQLRAKKTYRADVSLGTEVSDEQLNRLSKLEGEVQQDTPSRVSHRRSNRTRHRTVHEVQVERQEADQIELRVKADAGTYIKELISGDQGRTTPNLSHLLGTDATCEALDVMNIHEETQPDPPAHEESDTSS